MDFWSDGKINPIYSSQIALIQIENCAANEGKMAGRYQFDTHSTEIGLFIIIYCQVIGIFIK